MAPSGPPAPLGQRLSRALLRLISLVGALLLLSAVGVLLSELNARTFTVEAQDGRLVVMKGRLLPVGSAPFRPGDVALADAYAPLPLEGPAPGTLLQGKYRDRDELDRALFEVLETWSRPKIASDDPRVLEAGLASLRRAELLRGISAEQRTRLDRMKLDVAFYQARLKLDEARRTLSEGLSQLKVAAGSPNAHARSANQMLGRIEPTAQALDQALRAAVHELSAPAEPPPPATEEARPAPPAAAPDAGTGATALDAGTP